MKFNRLKNNCYYLELNNNFVVLISYESIIGFVDVENDLLFISEYFKKYSKTTTKHINLFKNEFFINKINYVENDLFYKIFNEISLKNINTTLNKFIYQNDNFIFE